MTLPRLASYINSVMIQVLRSGGIGYAVRAAQSAVGARVPRSVQSVQAEDLLSRLRRATGVGDGPSSKAHSRTAVAAALTESGRIGIDVEYVSDGRRIMEIARWLMDADAPDRRAAYRMFTFAEAHFKATGVWPTRALLRGVSAASQSHYVLGDLQVLHEDLGADFLLTLVWSGAGPAIHVHV
jgi:hypothetical protein